MCVWLFCLARFSYLEMGSPFVYDAVPGVWWCTGAKSGRALEACVCFVWGAFAEAEKRVEFWARPPGGMCINI